MEPPFPVAVIQSVLTAGVREFIVCAGARNSALVVVLAAAEKKVRLWQHFEERAAAFFAIGRIRTGGKPVAVVTTSGTAVAELFPAVIEAHYQGLPLIALTADRPRSYRGSGAPQAIEQPYLFGRYVSRFLDVENEPVDLAAWDRRAPLHLNVCLPEPDAQSLPGLRAAAAGMKQVEYIPPASGRSPQTRSACCASRLIMAGELLDEEIETAKDRALHLGGLIDAEASSGLREMPHLRDRILRCGEASARHLPVKEVFRLGGVPSNRYWRDLETRTEIKVTNWSRSGYAGLARTDGVAKLADTAEPLANDGEHPGETFMARDAALARSLNTLLAAHPSSEPGLMRLLSHCIPSGATVFTGNSLAVREWNLCAAWDRAHRVHVLRGANGIDGNLSAFLGIAADKPEAWCVTGDLTALYDLSAPWILRQLPAGRRRFVVIQNGGGKIFSRLLSFQSLNKLEQNLMENPHDICLKPWAGLWGLDHVSGGADLFTNSAALESLADHAVIELHPDPGETETFWEGWRKAEKEVWA